MRKYIFFLMALCLHSAARGQTQYEYWFDNDHSTAVTSTSSLVEADVSGLSETLHAIHIQVKGTGTKVVDHTIYTWKDENIDFEQYVVNTENEQMLSAPITRYFVKVPQQGITVRCWVDGNLLQESVATGQTVMLDLAAVSDGFHYLTVQPVGQGGGVVGTPHAYPFIKVPKTSGIDNLTCYYTIDGSFTGYVAGNLGNGTFQFDVDVSLLTDGIHRISTVFCDANGVIANAETHFFMKIPVGGYGIKEFWYWLNDDDAGVNDIIEVPVNPKQDPFNLVTELVLAEKDIRSKKFAFGFIGGDLTRPAIFAKNELHMRFFDVSGRFTDLVREYVDERVYKELDSQTAWALLDNNGPANLSAANAMQWYFLNVQAGNVLRFYLDHPATIQIFSATTGQEVYSAEGDDTTTQGEIQVPANDTYYLVVHDPSSSYYTNVTLNYNLIGRLGDVDGNGSLTIADAIAVVNHILGMTPDKFIEDAADVNRSGKVTIADAVGIVNIVLKDRQ